VANLPRISILLAHARMMSERHSYTVTPALEIDRANHEETSKVDTLPSERGANKSWIVRDWTSSLPSALADLSLNIQRPFKAAFGCIERVKPAASLCQRFTGRMMFASRQKNLSVTK
jgi:hypothetical protein